MDNRFYPNDSSARAVCSLHKLGKSIFRSGHVTIPTCNPCKASFKWRNVVRGIRVTLLLKPPWVRANALYIHLQNVANRSQKNQNVDSARRATRPNRSLFFDGMVTPGTRMAQSGQLSQGETIKAYAIAFTSEKCLRMLCKNDTWSISGNVIGSEAKMPAKCCSD